MADKWMYIPNNYTQIYPFIRLHQFLKLLDTQSNEPTKVQIVEPTNKKTLLKTFGTSVINSPMSPPSLCATRYNAKLGLLD